MNSFEYYSLTSYRVFSETQLIPERAADCPGRMRDTAVCVCVCERVAGKWSLALAS